MRILYLIPEKDSHRAKLGNDVLITPVTSGMPRRRQVMFGVPDSVVLSFMLKPEQYDYLMAFWRLTRGKAFAFRGIVDSSNLRWHEGKWIGVPTLVYEGANVFRFSCEVSVGPVTPLSRPKHEKQASHPYPILELETPIHTEINVLDAILTSAVYTARPTEHYTPTIKTLDAALTAIILRKYPKEGYNTTVGVLDATLTSVVKQSRGSEAYNPTASALDASLELTVNFAQQSEGITVAAQAIDATLTDWSRKYYNEEGYFGSVKPLDATLSEIENRYEHPDKDTYQSTIAALDAVLF